MGFALGWFLLAIACGIFADKRGRSGIGWFFAGLLASPLIAGVMLMVLPERERATAFNVLRPCGSCREQIRRDASKCKHCGTESPFADA